MCLQKKQLKQTTNQSQIQAHLLVIRPGLAATRTNEDTQTNSPCISIFALKIWSKFINESYIEMTRLQQQKTI